MLRYFSIILALSFTTQPAIAQDISRLGGGLTSDLPGRHSLQTPAPNVSFLNPKRELQLAGFSPFHKSFLKSEGLGPAFNHNSCGGCHIENGKGKVRVPRNKKQMHAMLVKVSLDQGLNEDGSPVDVPGVGEQLQEKLVNRRKRQFGVRLRFRRIRGEYPDGTGYKLLKPKLRFRVKGIPRRQINASLRMTPLLIGMGLLEAIPEADILALSDPADSNADGISGRPNYVSDKRNGGLALGRFGFRASHPSVEQQTAAAAFHDMGLTNDLFKVNEESSEISSDVLEALTVYQLLAGVPAARNQGDPQVEQGKQLFQVVGCNDCHVMTFETSHSEPELDGQIIHPFTDLLLHDMGPGLADDRAEFSASGSEWRTTPLWGLGFTNTDEFLSDSRIKPRFLHDGRARSIEEAILWHGGEATAARDSFKSLSRAEREALLAFLESL